MINFAIVGGGWRAEFYIRIANALPDKFNITGVFLRNPKTKALFEKKYDVKIFDSVDNLLETKPDFVVSCVNYNGICDEIEMLCNMGVAVLSETPAGASLDQIEEFGKKIKPEWRVQVAEQFHLQPLNQAIMNIIDSGILGQVNHLQMFCCHDYHAASLIRRFLKVGYEIPETISYSLPDSVTNYNTRDGIVEPRLIETTHTLALLKYNGKTAMYDFSDEQYFSDIRKRRMVIKGTGGEIVDDICTYLDGTTAVSFNLNRNMRGGNGNLDGLYLDSITGNGKILYKNSFIPSRLTDEEIAIAECLVNMDNYIKTGEDFYSLEEAMVDAKTSLLWKKNKLEF